MKYRWDEDDWKKLGPTAFIGVDDTKLFIWPGKGVFALVTRRAEAHSPGDMACRHLNFMQYLAQVRMIHYKMKHFIGLMYML